MLTGIFYLAQHPFYLEVTAMTVTNATRKLDPCGQYKEHKLEDLVLACGILPTHIDENNPESLMTQVARICNTVPEQHLIREAIHMDEDGVVYGDDQSIKYFPLAAITRNVGERFEELFIHNGGQVIVRESGDGAVVHYAVVINN